MGCKFEIDKDISKAHTMPSEFYTSPEVYECSKESIFASSWQFAMDIESIKTPNQVYPFTLLEGCLDEPLLLTRDSSDAIHCISNVCTHRGNIVCESPSYEKHLRCRYHGRRFDLDGTFKHMPEFEGAVGFPSSADNLAKIAFQIWEQFVFVSLSPHVSFDEVFAPMVSRFGWMPLRDSVFDSGRARDYLVKANWALYCDNYLEGFHIPFIHAGLNETLDYGNYTVELFDYCSLQLAVAKSGEHTFDLPSASSDYGKEIAAYYFWVFPNMMFNFYPWGLSINIVRPLAHNLTKISFLPYVWDASKMEQGAGAGLDRVEREDEAVVELVQRGLRSRLYDRGRYSPTREQGVHHFHRLLAAALGKG